MQKTVIPLSKSKLLGLATISALFVAGGYWMFGMDAADIEQQRRFNSPLFVHGLGLACIVLGALGCVAIARKALDSSPGLVLDELGLTDNSSAFSGGFIPWSSIEAFEVRQIQNQRILYVVLKDPAAYIARFGPLKQALLKANQRMAASPVAITSSSLPMGFDELIRLVEQYHAAAQQHA